ncbi:MAG: hypothetical protein ACRD0P_15700 [Stackebrandtia sp.]
MSGFNPSSMDGDPADTEIQSRIADAVAGLDELAESPTPRHVEVFESVHEVLSQTLSAVDEA